MKINKIESIYKVNLNLKKDNQEENKKNHQNQDNKFEKELEKQKKLNKN